MLCIRKKKTRINKLQQDYGSGFESLARWRAVWQVYWEGEEECFDGVVKDVKGIAVWVLYGPPRPSTDWLGLPQPRATYPGPAWPSPARPSAAWRSLAQARPAYAGLALPT